MIRDRKKHVAHIAFVVVVSIFGLVISTALLRSPAPLPAGSDGRRILVALAYDLVCITGILAVLFPLACSGILGARVSFAKAPERFGMRATRFLGILVVHGHHPSESGPTKHELLLGGRSFCATCHGLLTGAVVSLTTVTGFAVSGWPGWIGNYPAYLLYCAGVAAVLTGLTQILMADAGAKARFVLAFVFVSGTGLMLLATDLLTENLMADLFVVMLAVFWLLSRISLSYRD
jgi:hypothetical protein